MEARWPYVCSICREPVGIHPRYAIPVCPVHGEVNAINTDYEKDPSLRWVGGTEGDNDPRIKE